MRQRNQLVVATENFGREDNSSLSQVLKFSKDMNEQRNQAQKLVDVVVGSER